MKLQGCEILYTSPAVSNSLWVARTQHGLRRLFLGGKFNLWGSEAFSGFGGLLNWGGRVGANHLKANTGLAAALIQENCSDTNVDVAMRGHYLGVCDAGKFLLLSSALACVKLSSCY